MANLEVWKLSKIQNFSSISLKLCLLGQKNTGTRVVNTFHFSILACLDLGLSIMSKGRKLNFVTKFHRQAL